VQWNLKRENIGLKRVSNNNNERSKERHSGSPEVTTKQVRNNYFPGGFGGSDHAGGSDDGEVGLGGVGSVLGKAWCGEDGGRAKVTVKAKG